MGSREPVLQKKGRSKNNISTKDFLPPHMRAVLFQPELFKAPFARPGDGTEMWCLTSSEVASRSVEGGVAGRARGRSHQGG